MASQIAPSTASRKKVATYGMASRKKRNSNVAATSGFLSHRRREPDSSNESTVSSIEMSDPPRSKPQAMRLSPELQPQPQPISHRRSDDAQKRSHASAFVLDALTDGPEDPLAGSPTRRILDHGSSGRIASHRKSTSPNATANIRGGRPRSSLQSPGRNTISKSESHPLSRGGPFHLDGDSNGPPAAQLPARRRRLIDALTAQKIENSENPDDGSTWSPGRSFDSSQGEPFQMRPSPVKIDSPSRRLEVRGMTARKKIKFTYSQPRSMLSGPSNAESSGVNGYGEDHDILNVVPGRLSTPPRSPSPIKDVEEAENNNKHVIQSVHELRRAGAKNRFSDEMDDLLSRIGAPGPVPSTMRRNGLCELVQMLQREEFAGQFRDHASRDNIAKGVQDEKDIISAFVLTAVLVIFLTSNAAPHLLRQLSEDGIGLWLGGLFAVQDDITKIAAQRSANVSKGTRASLAGVKKILIQMPVWNDHVVLNMSPRTVALQLLNILIRSSDAQYLLQIVSDSSKDLATLADDFQGESSSDDIDFALLISILETQSGLAAIIGHQMSDIEQQAFRVAKFLRLTLRRWPHERGGLDATLLKLAINTTNNGTGSMAFNNVDLLSSLAGCICSGFGSVKSAIGNHRFENLVYDELLLILGIVINVVEHCENARSSVRGQPLEDLVNMWQENQALMNEADSVDKSKLSIALGYLAILLGYLFVSPASNSAQMRNATMKVPSLGELVASIQEFMAMHKSIDGRVHELEGLVTELRRQEQQERRHLQTR